jgi:hypothetical protein
MDLENVSFGKMEPGEDNDFVAGPHAKQARGKRGIQLEKGVGSAFIVEERRLRGVLDFRANYPDGFEQEGCHAVSSGSAGVFQLAPEIFPTRGNDWRRTHWLGGSWWRTESFRSYMPSREAEGE